MTMSVTRLLRYLSSGCCDWESRRKTKPSAIFSETETETKLRPMHSC